MALIRCAFYGIFFFSPCVGCNLHYGLMHFKANNGREGTCSYLSPWLGVLCKLLLCTLEEKKEGIAGIKEHFLKRNEHFPLTSLVGCTLQVTPIQFSKKEHEFLPIYLRKKERKGYLV